MQTLTIPMRELGFGFDIHIESWANKLRAYRVLANQRHPLEGGLGLALKWLEEFDHHGWLDSIPPEYRRLTAPFPEHQYQMLWLIANEAKTLDLLQQRPLLLALICQRYKVDNLDALSLCRQGQREILEALGLSGSKAALKFIDKLVLDYSQGDELDHIKRVLCKDSQRYLLFKHVSRVNYRALRFDQVFPFMSGSRLAQAISLEVDGARPIRVADVQDVIMLARQLDIDNPIETIRNMPTLAAFEALHDRWVRRNNRDRFRVNLSAEEQLSPYPQPLQGSSNIHPITNYKALRDEGCEQSHCIEIYHSRIKSGKYLVFSMTTPERLTIGIQIDDKRTFPFVIDQIAAERNRSPQEQSRQIIHAWFERQKLLWFEQKK